MTTSVPEFVRRLESPVPSVRLEAAAALTEATSPAEADVADRALTGHLHTLFARLNARTAASLSNPDEDDLRQDVTEARATLASLATLAPRLARLGFDLTGVRWPAVEWGEGLVARHLYAPGADLGGVVLRGADLSDSELSNARLCGTDLSGADLTGADLGSVDLSGAMLAGARLRGAELSSASLVDADLSGADLSDAHLAETDLTGADLTGALLG